jgi:hypothetical protein
VQSRHCSDDDGGDGDDLLPDRDVANRYKVHPLTIARWDRNERLNFPPAIEINGRKYRRRCELIAWERSRVVQRATKQTAA